MNLYPLPLDLELEYRRNRQVNTKQMLIMTGAIAASTAGKSLQNFDPDAKGLDDVLGRVFSAAGDAGLQYALGSVNNADDALRIAAMGINQYLVEKGLPGIC